MYERTGTGPDMLDGFINFARGIDGVEVAAQLRQIDNGQFRVSFRSRGRINVAKVAEKFGGGGHRNAAGCTIDGAADDVVSTVTDELVVLLGPCDDT
jgi:phosphoesterase RecJ-like protein